MSGTCVQPHICVCMCWPENKAMGQGKAGVTAQQHSTAGLGARQQELFPSAKPWLSMLEVLHSFMLCFVTRRLGIQGAMTVKIRGREGRVGEFPTLKSGEKVKRRNSEEWWC